MLKFSLKAVESSIKHCLSISLDTAASLHYMLFSIAADIALSLRIGKHRKMFTFSCAYPINQRLCLCRILISSRE